ncbi:retrovirus-related pol polyprotein from transposon TNT 1-94 [Tanacetum coccineum]|uniref:Retrovirus-related pol polyprotein from transposon TNT 1-94 n=1 Tax=Tanacetum coccineum TaxID=301880 RepID=A0ABQ4XQK3_9ASTR
MSTDKESSTGFKGQFVFTCWLKVLRIHGKIRIERYIRGKPLGKLIWRSIQNGPTPHPQITMTEGQGDAAVQVTRDKTDEEFTKNENDRELADIQATNILSQGLPRHVFNILNQTRTGKEIWDNVELLMKGSRKSLQQKKEELFDEYDRFRAIGNESIHDYFVRFHKQINDMKVTQLDIPAHQMNTKTYVELYTYLKSYEPHAMKTLNKQEQSSSIVDPLAYLATTSLTPPSQPPAQSSNDAMLATMNQIVNLLSGFQRQFPLTNNQLRTSSNSGTHATVHDGKIITEPVQRRASGNVGNTGNRGTKSYGQMTDNKGKKVICYNCRREGHVARQCKEKKRVKDSQYFKDKMLLMEAKEKGAVLDAEAEAFLTDVECTAPYDQLLAMTTTNVFEVSHEDAYDSDVDEGPNTAAAFMANLSSTNGASTSHVNEVHTNDNPIFDNVNHLMSHEMHKEEQLDSDVDSDIDDNTIPYHQYQIDSEVKTVPTKVSSVSPGEISMITILDDLRTQLDGHLKVNQEQSLVNESLRAELDKCKLEMQSLERNKVKHDLDKTIVQRNKRNAELEQENVLLKSNLSQKDESINFLKTENKKVLSEKKDLEERYLEEIVCLKSANKVATDILQRFQQPTQTIPMLTKRPKLATHDLHKIALGSSNPWYAKQAKIAQPTMYDGHALLKPTHTSIKVHDSEDSLVQAEISRTKMSERPGIIQRINYAELNALYSHFVPQKELSQLVQSLKENLVNEVTEFIRIFDELDAEYEQCFLEKKNWQIEKKNILIQNECLITDSIAKDICSIMLASDRDRPLSEELTNAHSRDVLIGKITAENTKLKTELISKFSSGSIACEKPKVLAPGMYAISPKYIPPQRRVNRVVPTPLPKKQQVTFKKPPRPSNRPTPKTVVKQNKKPNIPVNLSTGVKPATGASKPMSKSDTRNHSTLPAKSEKARRVEDHHRNLNKKNHVDSRLNDKNTGFASNSNNVCNVCNECLIFVNHDNCVVRSLKSVKPVNAKIPKAKHNVKTTKQVWKPKVVTSVKHKWKPTGRHFTLYDKYPLTRIVEPIVEPLELTPCVSSNSKVTMISRFSDYKLSDRKAGSKGISGCSRHMTGDRSKLINYVEKFIGTVRFGNDQFAMIVGYGDYKLGDTIISRVYYVEGLSHNLFSVGQFCDGGLEVAFRQHTCHIRNKDMVDLLQGSRTTNLYSISLNDMLASSPVCLLTKASSTKSWLWHRRLNHLNFGTLNELARNDLVRGLPKLKYDKDHLCPSCQLGKSKKSSHPLKTVNTNTEILNTLHMDLCGPMRIESINKKKYILVIVDDYTRFGWVRFLRTKDETPEAIKKFIVTTQRALNATVRYVRTDNGTEFVNKTLTAFFESVGITHNTSVPRSPQQNGVVERRNRTLMEAARTMLIFAKAPLFLWAEAVATACYTLNRSLIHTLHGKTYYELLKGKKPELKYFRVFGSLCYPTNDYDDLGKLKAKADIGIFVGYAPTKKAYRIFNKRTRKIQETVHVTFDELSEGMTSDQHSSGLAPQRQMTSVQSSTGLEPNPMAPVHNGAGPEISALQSGRTRSELVNDPTTPSVPPSAKQLDELFQPLFDDDEEFPPAVLKTPVHVNAAQAPEIATGSP